MEPAGPQHSRPTWSAAATSSVTGHFGCPPAGQQKAKSKLPDQQLTSPVGLSVTSQHRAAVNSPDQQTGLPVDGGDGGARAQPPPSSSSLKQSSPAGHSSELSCGHCVPHLPLASSQSTPQRWPVPATSSARPPGPISWARTSRAVGRSRETRRMRCCPRLWLTHRPAGLAPLATCYALRAPQRLARGCATIDIAPPCTAILWRHAAMPALRSLLHRPRVRCVHIPTGRSSSCC